MSTATPIIRQDGEGEQMWFAGGGIFTWKATAAETGGAFLMMEDRMERGKTTTRTAAVSRPGRRGLVLIVAPEPEIL
jgi:hypothetical protein